MGPRLGGFSERRQRIAPDSAPSAGLFQSAERGLAPFGGPDLGRDISAVPHSQQRRPHVARRQPGRPASPGEALLQAGGRIFLSDCGGPDGSGGQERPGQEWNSGRLGCGAALFAGAASARGSTLPLARRSRPPGAGPRSLSFPMPNGSCTPGRRWSSRMRR